jgi:hypothetical protein
VPHVVQRERKAFAEQRQHEEKTMTIAINPAKVRTLDMKLEVIVIPVSDVERSKRFYGGLGWRLDADFGFDDGFRVVQFTPPGSGASVKGTVPGRFRHRGCAQRTARSRGKGR